MSLRAERRTGFTIGFRAAIGRGSRGLPVVAVGIFVVVLTVLMLVALVGVANGRERRIETRTANPPTIVGQEALAVAVLTPLWDFDGVSEIRRVLVGAIKPGFYPPGLDRLPSPGECFVSPVLAARLRTNPLLAERYCGGSVEEIAAEGLADGRELFAYVGVDPEALRDKVGSFSAIGFGGATGAVSERDAALATIRKAAAGGALVLLAPLGLLLVTAAGMATTAREARLSSLALVGMSRTGVRATVAGEMLVGALAGSTAGVVGFLLLRGWMDGAAMFGLEWNRHDARPGIALVVVPAIVVWLAVAIPRWTNRRAVESPLAVRRQAPQLSGGALVRYTPLALSFSALLAVVVIGKEPPIDTATIGVVIAFYATITACLSLWLALYPATRHLGRLMARVGHRNMWLLAGRRLQRARPATIRPAASVAIAIVLLGLGLFAIRIAELGTVEHLINTADTPGGRAIIVHNPTPQLLADPPSATDGAEEVLALRKADLGPRHEGVFGVLIGTCAQVKALLGAEHTECDQSVSYRIAYPGVDPPGLEGSRLEIFVTDERLGQQTVYSAAMPTETLPMPLPGGDLGILDYYVIPEEQLSPPLTGDPNRLVVIHDGAEQREATIRRHIYATEPTANVWSSRQAIARGLALTQGFTQLVTGIALMIALSLLLSVAIQTIDAIDQRRRDTAALVLAGTPRRMLQHVEAAVATTPILLAFVASFTILMLSDLARGRVVGAPLDLDTPAYLLVGAATTAGIATIGWLATLGIPNEPSPDTIHYE